MEVAELHRHVEAFRGGGSEGGMLGAIVANALAAEIRPIAKNPYRKRCFERLKFASLRSVSIRGSDQNLTSLCSLIGHEARFTPDQAPCLVRF